MAVREILAGKAVVEIGIRNKIEAGLKQVSGKLRKFAGGVTSLGGAFAGFGAATTAVFGGLAGALAFPTQLAAGLETTTAQFETMLGSGEKAQAMLRELKAFAASTPLQFQDIADAAQKLLAFGVAAEDIPTELRRVGDVASAIGAPLGEIAEIYGKAKTQGRLFMEDINQLTGRGIPIIQELAKQFGIAESEIKELVSSGAVNFGHLQEAFRSLTSEGGKFAGMMEKQSKTLSGRWSTLKDNIIDALIPIGQAISEMLKPLLSVATSLVAPIARLIKENAGLAKVVAIVAGSGTAAGVAFMALGGTFIAFGGILSMVTTAGVALGTILGALSGPVVIIAAAVAASLAVYATLAGVMVYAAAQSGLLGEAFVWLRSVFGQLLETARETMGGIIAALEAGQYQLAARVLWAGLRLAFFQGADASLEAFQYLWENAFALSQRFFVALAELALDFGRRLPGLISSGLSGGMAGALANVTAAIMSSEIDLGDVADGSVARARQQLRQVTQEANAARFRARQRAAQQSQPTRQRQGTPPPRRAQVVAQNRARLAEQQQARRFGPPQPIPRFPPPPPQRELQMAIDRANAGAGIRPDANLAALSASIQGGARIAGQLTASDRPGAAALGARAEKALEQTAAAAEKIVRNTGLTVGALRRLNNVPVFGR